MCLPPSSQPRPWNLCLKRQLMNYDRWRGTYNSHGRQKTVQKKTGPRWHWWSAKNRSFFPCCCCCFVLISCCCQCPCVSQRHQQLHARKHRRWNRSQWRLTGRESLSGKFFILHYLLPSFTRSKFISVWRLCSTMEVIGRIVTYLYRRVPMWI